MELFLNIGLNVSKKTQHTGNAYKPVFLKTKTQNIMRHKEELRSILALPEIKKTNLSIEEKISYQKLTNFIQGSDNWCPVNDHIPASIYVDFLIRDVFNFLYKPHMYKTEIKDYLANFNNKLFISVILKRLVVQHKASRIAAKIKNQTDLSPKENQILDEALTDFLENINAIIDAN